MRLISRKSKGLGLTRKKEIDRDRILDAAERVILESGGRNFTLEEMRNGLVSHVGNPSLEARRVEAFSRRDGTGAKGYEAAISRTIES
jgi:hypothetical protein